MLVSPQGESDRDWHASLSRCQRSTEKPLPISRFLYPRLLILFLQSPDPLLGKGSIKKGAAASQQLLAHS